VGATFAAVAGIAVEAHHDCIRELWAKAAIRVGGTVVPACSGWSSGAAQTGRNRSNECKECGDAAAH
jgi:hypothetical protein